MARRGLGKGLEALIPEAVVQPQDRVLEVAVVAIQPNPFQPRRAFDPERLEELAASIRAHGILQPLIVRRLGSGYQLVAGERRLRAAGLAGLERVPVVVRDIPEERMLEIALVENLQRADLDPIEEALALKMLLDRGLQQEEVADLVGRSRPAVANAVRLLQLPERVQRLVAEGSLSPGQARALLGLPADEIEHAAELVVREGMRVRDVEALVAKRRKGRPKARQGSGFGYWEERLSERFGAPVRIVGDGRRGRIVVEFRGEDQLQRLLRDFLPETGEELG